MKHLACLGLAVALGLGFTASASADSIALRFLGTGVAGSLSDALDSAGIDLATDTNLSPEVIESLEAAEIACFDIPLIEPASEIVLGRGIDCLEVVEAVAFVDDADVSLSLRALSLFVFESGTVVTLGSTSVRPFRPGVGDAAGGVTHMTGSIPSDSGGVIGGTGAFADKVGAARVSGAVNLSNLAAAGEIFFDCLWIIQVEDTPPPGLRVRRNG